MKKMIHFTINITKIIILMPLVFLLCGPTPVNADFSLEGAPLIGFAISDSAPGSWVMSNDYWRTAGPVPGGSFTVTPPTRTAPPGFTTTNPWTGGAPGVDGCNGCN